jgi:two-component system cell cycle response regulator
VARRSTAGRKILADVPCRIAVLAGVGWLICYTVLTLLSKNNPNQAKFVGDILYLLPITAGAVAAAVAARRLTGRHRALWKLLAIAYGAQLAGELIWTGYDYLIPSGPPDPSFADVCYLTASVATVVAVLVGFGGGGRLRHLRGLLDTLLLLASAGAMGWQILIRPQLSDGMALSNLFTVAYPLLDIALICCLGIVGIGGHRQLPLSVRLVGYAGGLNAISDMLYTYQLVFSTYASGSWVDVAFEASATCSFVAAVVAIRFREPAARRRTFDRGFTVLPVLTATLASFTLVIVERVTGGTTSVLTLIIVGALFLATLTRQYLFAADRASLATELRHAVREQQRLAVTDGLTGLHNRRFLTERMAAEEGSGPDGRPISLLVIDLDHFKKVNDTYGHPVGDVVLRESAARIAAVCRTDDVVARYGGEEFVVFCPAADESQAWALAERIRQSIIGTPIAAGRTQIPISASIGVATRPAGAADSLMTAADQALYRAKTAGRDRVAVAAPG